MAVYCCQAFEKVNIYLQKFKLAFAEPRAMSPHFALVIATHPAQGRWLLGRRTPVFHMRAGDRTSRAGTQCRGRVRNVFLTGPLNLGWVQNVFSILAPPGSCG